MLQRIESGTTGKGIPDLYLRFPAQEVWVELKNDQHVAMWYPGEHVIDWRRGQQAWHLDYYRTAKRPVLTLVATKDGFWSIDVTKRYHRNITAYHDRVPYNNMSELMVLLEARGGHDKASD
jgi:hypothetical protein